MKSLGQFSVCTTLSFKSNVRSFSVLPFFLSSSFLPAFLSRQGLTMYMWLTWVLPHRSCLASNSEIHLPLLGSKVVNHHAWLKSLSFWKPLFAIYYIRDTSKHTSKVWQTAWQLDSCYIQSRLAKVCNKIYVKPFCPYIRKFTFFLTTYSKRGLGMERCRPSSWNSHFGWGDETIKDKLTILNTSFKWVIKLNLGLSIHTENVASNKESIPSYLESLILMSSTLSE